MLAAMKGQFPCCMLGTDEKEHKLLQASVCPKYIYTLSSAENTAFWAQLQIVKLKKVYKCTRTRAHTHTHVRALAHTHTHTHIHMHTLSFILSISIYTFSHPIFQLQLIAERTDRATARATKRAKDAPDVGDGQQQDEQPKSAGVYPFTVYSCAHVLQMTSSLQCQKRCSPILTWPKQQGCSHVCCSCLFHTTVLTLTLVWVHTSTASTLTPSVRKPPHVCKPGEWVSGTCAPCGYV